MKLLAAIFVAIIVIAQKVPTVERCDLSIAKNALAPRIFAETTVDGQSQSTLVTRFFHNKVTILGNELGRCYFNFFDLNLIANSTSIFGLLPWLYFIYSSSSRIGLILPILAVPLFPIMTGIMVPILYAHKIFAMIGLLYFAKRK